MKRAVRRTLLGVGLAGVVTAVTVAATVAPSWATPPVGLVNVPLARGTNTSHGTIPLKFGTDVARRRSRSTRAAPLAGTRIREARSWSSSRVRSPSTHRSAPSARSPRTARGRRSSSDLAKWITSSTPARSRTSFSSPSRVCLRANPRELTSRTPARARVSDDLTDRDFPCGGGIKRDSTGLSGALPGLSSLGSAVPRLRGV